MALYVHGSFLFKLLTGKVDINLFSSLANLEKNLQVVHESLSPHEKQVSEHTMKQ
jgi:hypothetical protein